MDTAQWPQEIMVNKAMEDHHNIISKTCASSLTTTPPSTISNNNNNSNNNNKGPSTSLERKIRPQKDAAVNCPRCNSTNTKFCYYNNYSLTQPRYFCKTCRRYWTEGGSLRNIPVGGGSRKNKRSSSSSSSSLSPSNKRISSHDLVGASVVQSQHHHLTSSSNPNHHQGQDLNLGGFHHHHQEFRSLSDYIQLPIMETHPNPKGYLPNSTTTTTTTTTTTAAASVDHHHHQQQQQHHLSALELLNGLTSSSSRGLTPFMPMSVPDPSNNNGVYTSGYPSLQDFKPSLNFSLDGSLGSGYGSLQVQQQGEGPNVGGNGRLLFPFEDLKQASNNTNDNNGDNHHHHNHNNNSNNNNHDHDHQQERDEHGDSITTGYWSGMLNAGGSW